MRIISKEHDYYDGVMGLGMDRTLIYKRERVEISPNKIPTSLKEMYYHFPYTIRTMGCPELSKRVVGFCGRLYPCIRVIDTNCYTYEALLEIANVLPLGVRKPYLATIQGAAAPFKKSLCGPIEDRGDLFHSLASPTFVLYWESYSSPKLVLNPLLKLEGFHRLLDSHSTYMEISQYLGGVLGQGAREVGPTGDDKVLRDSKGFDENSFRTASPGKKYKRRRR
jgi:hypothetical protein